MPNWRFSNYANRLVPSAIRGLADMQGAADTIHFGPGQPDETVFPVDDIRQSLDRILAAPAAGRQALQYGPSDGDPRLRDLIAAYMAQRGVRCTRENVLLTNGSQQALHFVAALLLEPGDVMAVQVPTYPGALQIFAARGAAIRSLEDIERDPAARPALIYAMANFHNPTGRSMALEERRALLALARARGAVVVEDDPYEVVRYEGEPLPPLLALDAPVIDEARALYLGTFSKSVVPGFRIGWVVGPRPVIAALASMKQTEDLQAGMLAQACLADIFGTMSSVHAERLRAAYRKRRDAMVEALARAAGNLATWSVPSGGFFLWLTLPEGLDTSAMLPHAARNGVTYVPGRAFYHDGGGANRLRLSYSSAPPERIGEGVRRLVETIRATA
jgi:DNA-binding transcriptional MocR family regulator